MSWAALGVLAAGAYLLKAAGLVLVGGRRLPPRVQSCLTLIPAALLAALVVTNTFAVAEPDGGQQLVLDARALGVGVAALAAWRQAPFPVVVVLAAGVTALARGLGA